MEETLQIRIHGEASKPALVYLPGLHGDWTLVAGFRLALAGRVRFVEFTYPRTLRWSLEDYADAVAGCLAQNGITHGWVLGESFGSQVAWALVRGERFHEPPTPAICAPEPERPPLTPSLSPPRGEGARWAGEGWLGGGSSLSLRTSHFQVSGLILAGGFVKHPFKWNVKLAGRFAHGVSLTWLTRLLFFYAKASRWRFRKSAEATAGIAEFVARRTELDKEAAVHRLRLVAANDPRPIARRTGLPVHHLSGLWDPVVPWPFVRSWLRRECPGWRGGRVVPLADHNVLGTAPRQSAGQVLAWMGVE